MAIRGTTKTLLQAALVFVGAGLVARAMRPRQSPTRKRKPEADCSQVTDNGGTIEGVKYVERVRGGASPDETLPLIVVLHSKGGNPTGAASFSGRPAKARVVAPAGAHRFGQGYEWVQANSKTDLPGFERDLQAATARLESFIRALMQCRPTEGKPIVTGASQGGHMTYAMASLYPSLIRGGVALLGYIPPNLWNPGMAMTYGLHTTGDNTVPYDRTVQMWESLQRQGAQLSTQSFPGGHSIPSAMGQAWRERVLDLL